MINTQYQALKGYHNRDYFYWAIRGSVGLSIVV